MLRRARGTGTEGIEVDTNTGCTWLLAVQQFIDSLCHIQKTRPADGAV